jgi:hypothetical protein
MAPIFFVLSCSDGCGTADVTISDVTSTTMAYGSVFAFTANARAIPLYDNFPGPQYHTTSAERAIVQDTLDKCSSEMTDLLEEIVVVPDSTGDSVDAFVSPAGSGRVAFFAEPSSGRLGPLKADQVGLATTTIHELRHVPWDDLYRWSDIFDASYYFPTRSSGEGFDHAKTSADEYRSLFAELYADDSASLLAAVMSDSDLKTDAQLAADMEAYLRTAGKWVGLEEGVLTWRSFATSPDDFLNPVDSQVAVHDAVAGGRTVHMVTLGFMTLAVSGDAGVLLVEDSATGGVIYSGPVITGLPFVTSILSSTMDLPTLQPLRPHP